MIICFGLFFPKFYEKKTVKDVNVNILVCVQKFMVCFSHEKKMYLVGLKRFNQRKSIQIILKVFYKSI